MIDRLLSSYFRLLYVNFIHSEDAPTSVLLAFDVSLIKINISYEALL